MEFIGRSYFRVIFAMLIFAYGCSPFETFDVSVKRPADIDVHGINRIAIAEISGEGGLDLTPDLTMALMHSARFTVLDRENVDRIMQEQSIRNHSIDNGIHDSLLDAVILVSGQIRSADYSENVTNSSFTDRNGTTHIHFYRTGHYVVRCFVQVSDTRSGAILSAKESLKDATDVNDAIDTDPTPIDKSHLQAVVLEELAQDFLKTVSPYDETVSVKLYNDNDIPEMDRVIRLCKAGEWHTAYDSCIAAANNYKTNDKLFKIYFNAGVAALYDERYDIAHDLITKALTLSQCEECTKELETISVSKKQTLKLKKQLSE